MNETWSLNEKACHKRKTGPILQFWKSLGSVGGRWQDPRSWEHNRHFCGTEQSHGSRDRGVLEGNPTQNACSGPLPLPRESMIIISLMDRKLEGNTLTSLQD